MSIHRFQITAGPTSGAAVHADLSTDDVWVLAESLDLGEPDVSFDRAGIPIEGARTISASVHIKGTGVEAGVVMQQIARAISLPGRWLLIQREPSTDPVWFRLHPASPGSLDIDRAWVDRKDGFFTWQLALVVDSTAVGERRTIPQRGSSSATSVIPNSGTVRGVAIDAPGEAPTPLRIDLKPDVALNGRRPLVSCFSVPWDSPLLNAAGDAPQIVFEDSEWTPGAGATRTTGSTFLSGGTGLSATTDTTATRTILGDGLSSWRPEPGRYLVLARLYREGGIAEAEIRFGQRWFSATSWQEWRTYRPVVTNDGGWRSSWLVLGYLQHPMGDTGEGLDPAELMPPAISVELRPTVTHATNKIHFDQFAFVPVELARGAMCTATFAQFEPGVGYGSISTLRFDAEHRRAAIVDNFGSYHAVPQPLRTGGRSVAVPGMATCVSVFLDTSDRPTDIESISILSDLTISAAPRVLHLGQER